MQAHIHSARVYYEDTDLAGIVYYANYLKYIERGRSSLIRELGIDQNALAAADFVFAVHKLGAQYHAPARLDDLLTIETRLSQPSAMRLLFMQRVLCENRLLFSAEVEVIAMSKAGRPKRLPTNLRDTLAKFLP